MLYKRLALLFLIALQCACAGDAVLQDPNISEPEFHIYHAEYDNVWRAIQLSVRKYPIHLNNIESGILETDYIKGDKIFAEPVESKNIPGMRYKITLRAIKGKVENRSVVKVVCTKAPEIQRDFFTGYQSLPSDGIEEDVILYRIGRYLEMERVLTRASASKN